MTIHRTKKSTSKIKEVVRTKDYAGTHGTIIYHDLLMENGDKIQLGTAPTTITQTLT